MLLLYPIKRPKNRWLELPVFISMTSIEDFSTITFFKNWSNLRNKVGYRSYNIGILLFSLC